VITYQLPLLSPDLYYTYSTGWLHTTCHGHLPTFIIRIIQCDYIPHVLLVVVRPDVVTMSPNWSREGSSRHRKTTVILSTLSMENPGGLPVADVSGSGVLASSRKLHEDVEVFPRWERPAKQPIAALQASILMPMTCNKSNDNKGKSQLLQRLICAHYKIIGWQMGQGYWCFVLFKEVFYYFCPPHVIRGSYNGLEGPR
jgi:hypothetical protein